LLPPHIFHYFFFFTPPYAIRLVDALPPILLMAMGDIIDATYQVIDTRYYRR